MERREKETRKRMRDIIERLVKWIRVSEKITFEVVSGRLGWAVTGFVRGCEPEDRSTKQTD